MNKLFYIAGGLVVIGVLAFLIFLSPAQDHTAMNTMSDTKAPDFALQNYEGKTISLSDFKDAPLVINSWATWCPFCGEELKDFAAAQKEFSEKVKIIAIDRGEPPDTAKKFIDGLGVTGDLIFLLDPADSFYKSIGGFAMPETIFVDSAGNIVDHKRGPMKLDEIKRRIQAIL